jgi:hypothetical protein
MDFLSFTTARSRVTMEARIPITVKRTHIFIFVNSTWCANFLVNYSLWFSGYQTDNKPLVTHVQTLNKARKLAISANGNFLSSSVSSSPPIDATTPRSDSDSFGSYPSSLNPAGPRSPYPSPLCCRSSPTPAPAPAPNPSGRSLLLPDCSALTSSWWTC